MIFDPPNLSKRSTKSDSRAKVTKGLFIFSPKHGRMQKFTTFYQAGFENVQNFSIFTCMFSSGWGPYPNLKVLLCEKMHDHLVVFSGPWGPRLPCQEFGLWFGVPPVMRRIFIISKVCYDFYLAVPFGHWQLALLQVFFPSDCSSRMWKTGGDECEASGSLRGHVVGQAPHNMPSKNFWKN